MPAAFVEVRVGRPLMHEGQRVEAGAVLTVSMEQAAALLDSGRAELVDANDGLLIQAERRTATARQVAALPRVVLSEARSRPRGWQS